VHLQDLFLLPETFAYLSITPPDPSPALASILEELGSESINMEQTGNLTYRLPSLGDVRTKQYVILSSIKATLSVLCGIELGLSG
jgi:hypothetical protein